MKSTGYVTAITGPDARLLYLASCELGSRTSLDGIPYWTPQLEHALVFTSNTDHLRAAEKFPAARFFKATIIMAQRLLMRSNREAVTPKQVHYSCYKTNLLPPDIKEHKKQILWGRQLQATHGTVRSCNDKRVREYTVWIDVLNTEKKLAYEDREAAIKYHGHDQLNKYTVMRRGRK